ncbi:D-alanyl-D-alanine carboxypeptidase [Streptomyces sp. GXMU-J5]|uniref:D-alanyl-D-alanine carboxypeptidase n=1 Tax=Streptomyces beihaiensis TaxID=2984495 RepID=A0ABT3U031_9ACTN|nr:D-alanyl-D-alanine carboxypeptidase [Streptomyces beihaiensis]
MAGAPPLPEVSALSWTVSDAADGKVLAAKAPHRHLPPASTLKTLFAVTVLPKFPASTVHTVTGSDLADVPAGSSLVGVQQGMRYTVGDLWRGAFLASGNDAVHVLAHMNGGVPQTVREMQRTAERIGAHDTSVRSPDGFDTPGQYSSAYDLALIAREGFKNPDFRRYMGTKWAQFPARGSKTGFGIQNTDRLLVGSHGVTPYRGLIGVKNGYTSHAGNTLVSAAERNGRTILVTVMNPQSGSGNAVYEEARALLDWGFAAAPHAPAKGLLGTPAVHRTARPGPPAVAVASQARATAGPSELSRRIGLGVAIAALAAVPFVLARGRRKKKAGSTP